MKKILFLTVNNLTTNPRLLKELQLASQHFECTVYAFRMYNWSDSFDDKLRAELPGVRFTYLSAGRKPFLPWLWSSLAERVAAGLSGIFSASKKINAYGHSKRTFLLNKALQKNRQNYDLVIAHNLAALYPAFCIAKKKAIPFAFDVEDYHPGEADKQGGAAEKTRRESLMRNILPSAAYISYASPLFRERTEQLFAGPVNMPQLFIPNSFREAEFILPKPLPHKKLRAVWFSQHINIDRGLEEILEAAVQLKDKPEIHLIGHLNADFGKILEPLKDLVTVHPPMAAEQLHAELSGYDIGLAVEQAKTDANRDIALTNKIYAYAQAGLLILATDTQAQKWFANEFPGNCVLTGQSPKEIQAALDKLILQKDTIRAGAEERFKTAGRVSWERQSNELLTLWKKITDAV